jgi:hypothetical protein
VLYTVNASTFSVNFNRRGFPVSVRADDGSRIDIKKKGGTLRLKPRLQNVPAQSRTATTLAVTAAPTAESTQCVASRLGFRSSVGFTREQIQNGFRVGDNAIGLGVADIVDEGLCATQNIVERVFSIATRDPDASIFDLARNFLQSDVLAAMEQGGRSTAVVEVLLDAETIAREDDLQVGAGKVALERAIKAARDYSFAIQKKLERLFGPRIADSRPAALAPDAPVAPYPVSEPTQPTEPPASATTTSSTTTSTTTLPFIPLLYSGTFGPVSAGSAGCGGNVTINGDMAITISGEAGEDARGVVNWTASFAQFGPLAYSASGPLDPLSYTGLLRMTRFSTAEITSFQNGYAQVTIVSGVQIRRSGETAFCFDGTVTASVGVRMDRTGGD